MLITVANVLFLVFFPLLFIGLINRVKSFWGGRQGPSALQPFRDFWRLMKKGEVVSTTTSFVFAIAPSVTLASVIVASLVVPLFCGRSLIPFDLDFVLFAYVLAAGKFFAILGAMDTGSSFEGMGASREATFGSLVEPAFFIMIASLAFIARATSFEGLMALSRQSRELSLMLMVLCALTLFIMILVEGCRVPVDDPNTHLELTMIHEVMVLDNSGPDLGFIMYAAALKMVIIGALAANIMLPAGLSPLVALPAFLGVQVLIAVLIGTIESLMARLRMSHVPQFILFMSSMSVIVLSIIVLYISGGLQ